MIINQILLLIAITVMLLSIIAIIFKDKPLKFYFIFVLSFLMMIPSGRYIELYSSTYNYINTNGDVRSVKGDCKRSDSTNDLICSKDGSKWFQVQGYWPKKDGE